MSTPTLAAGRALAAAHLPGAVERVLVLGDAAGLPACAIVHDARLDEVGRGARGAGADASDQRGATAAQTCRTRSGRIREPPCHAQHPDYGRAPYMMCSATPSGRMPCVLKRCFEWSYDASWPDVSSAARTLVAPTPVARHMRVPIKDLRRRRRRCAKRCVAVYLCRGRAGLRAPQCRKGRGTCCDTSAPARHAGHSVPTHRKCIITTSTVSARTPHPRLPLRVSTHHIDAVHDAAGLALHADLDQVDRVGQRRPDPARGESRQHFARQARVALPVALIEGLDGRVQP